MKTFWTGFKAMLGVFAAQAAVGFCFLLGLSMFLYISYLAGATK